MQAEDRWTERVVEFTGKPFYYRETSRCASGLVNMALHARNTFHKHPEQVKWLVIQKPQAVRFPWWIENWQDKISCSRMDYIDDIDWAKGRKMSKRRFDKLKSHKRADVAEMIYREELQCIKDLQRFFHQAMIVYFHYWADYIVDHLNRPELAEVNVRLGEAVESMGIQNWKMVVDPKEIPGVYDDEGDIIMDNDILDQHGWIRHPGDCHPGPAFHDIMFERVKRWITGQETSTS